MQTVLTIGLIASDLEISNKLSTLLGENGVILRQRIALTDLDDSHVTIDDLDIWLIDLAEDDWSDSLDLMLDEAKIPVLMNEQQALFGQSHPEFWVKKLLVRLGELVLAEPTATSGMNLRVVESPVGLELEREDPIQEEASENNYPVWVLAASLGGPAALKRFLQALPEGLNAGFILVQHIDNNFIPVLGKILEDYSSLKVRLPAMAGKVKPGEIIMAPVDKRLTMTSTGMLLQIDSPWTLPYSPCIDDVLSDVSRHWENSGTIIFSGMAGDAVIGAQLMRDASKPVWIQDSQSCANSAMPDEIGAAGLADYRGTPEQLAKQLVAHLHRKTMAAKIA